MRTPAKKLVIPTPQDSALAAEALRSLSGDLSESAQFTLQLRARRGSSRSVALPSLAVKLLVQIIEQTAAGNAVSVVPARRELTTQEAADILNVSRPYLISLVKKGEIPARLIGRHRRIPLLPLLEYKRKTVAIREEALDQMAAEAQALKLY
jgi:excisionase family DNA binding protein